jgi:U4/U6 small nuclear ribonucleoprotein PRP31
MSLAEELLADFESDDGDDEIVADAAAAEVAEDQMDVDMVKPFSQSSIRAIAKLRDSQELYRLIHEIDGRLSGASDRPGTGFTSKTQIDGPVESHPEYVLIVEANNKAVEIDNELALIHKFVKEKYSKRFPELESLVPSPLDYMLTARHLANDPKSNATKSKYLSEFLNPAAIMVVTVTSATTIGKPLTDSEMDAVFEACDMAKELNEIKGRILMFVESQMSFIAPNLSAIVGASIAAKLMGIAGGLTALSKMPACNVELLGSSKKNLQGFSTKAILPHTGFIYYCDLVQNTPPDLRRRAAKLCANKCSMVSRVDACHASPDGSVGRAYREKVEKALDKLQEPPPVKQVKALPAPIDQPGKKRGGKRVRRMKERIAMTEFRKQANRMNFGDIEDDAYQEDLGFTAGVLGKAGKGRIRAPQVDEKTKVRISKTLQKNLQKQQQVFGGSTTVRRQVSGTASSVAFTPLQGFEIKTAEDRVKEANAKYFSSTSGFMSVVKGSTSNS